MEGQWDAAPHWHQQQNHYYHNPFASYIPGSDFRSPSDPGAQAFPQPRRNAQLSSLSSQVSIASAANENQNAHEEPTRAHNALVDNRPMFLDGKSFKELQFNNVLANYSIPPPPTVRVIYTSSHVEADRLLYEMLASFDWTSTQLINPDPRWGQPRIIGLDAEWRSLPRKPEAPVALVQISSQSTVLLLHLCKMAGATCSPVMILAFINPTI